MNIFFKLTISLWKNPSCHLLGVLLCSVDQDLEYPGFEVEDQVWNRLLELRGSKIRKEMELKKQQRTFAVMKRKLEALQADCDSVDSQVSPPYFFFSHVFKRGNEILSYPGPLHYLRVSRGNFPLGAMRNRLVHLTSSVNWPGRICSSEYRRSVSLFRASCLNWSSA